MEAKNRRNTSVRSSSQRIFWASTMSAVLLLSGCGAKPSDLPASQAAGQGASGAPEENLIPVLSGYVVDLGEKGEVLVVSPEKQDFSANGGDDAFYDAIRFSAPPTGNPAGIKIGMRVNVWMEEGAGMNTPYPGEASAARIDIEEEAKPEGADLTSAEAVEQALESLHLDEGAVPVVLGTNYDGQRRYWTVEMLDDKRKPISIEIEDRKNLATAGEVPEPGSSIGAEESSDLIGYVVRREGSRVLVVSPQTKKFGAGGEGQEVHEAIWFGQAPANVEVGMQVEAWAEGGIIGESYPAQAGTERIEILEGLVLEAAELKEDEAIRRAFEQLEPEDLEFPFVLSSEYDSSKKLWTVVILKADQQQVSIEVKDAE